MVTTTSDRWNRLTNRFRRLPIVVRRVHRIVGALWILSVALSYAVTSAGGEVPGPSLPALSLVTLVFTGGYLLLRPWVRRTTVSDRLKRLTNWDVSRSVFVRRTHRIAATVWLLLLALALSIEAAGGPESPLLIVPVVVFLVYITFTGAYMFLRPWVNRFRDR